MDIVFSVNPATVGDCVRINCTKSPAFEENVSWLNQRFDQSTLSLCNYKLEKCIPSISIINPRYSFNSDFANRKLTMTITNVEQADAGVYICKDSSPDVGQATLQVQPGSTVDAVLNIIGLVIALVLLFVVSFFFYWMCSKLRWERNKVPASNVVNRPKTGTM